MADRKTEGESLGRVDKFIVRLAELNDRLDKTRLGRLVERLHRWQEEREERDLEFRKYKIQGFLIEEFLGLIGMDIGDGFRVWPEGFPAKTDQDGRVVREAVLNPLGKGAHLIVKTDKTASDKGEINITYPADLLGNYQYNSDYTMVLSFNRQTGGHLGGLLGATLDKGLQKLPFTDRESILLWEKWQKPLRGFIGNKIKGAQESQKVTEEVRNRAK